MDGVKWYKYGRFVLVTGSITLDRELPAWGALYIAKLPFDAVNNDKFNNAVVLAQNGSSAEDNCIIVRSSENYLAFSSWGNHTYPVSTQIMFCLPYMCA